MKNKYLSILGGPLLLAAGLLLWANCADDITEPASVQFSTTVSVVDTSFVTSEIFRQNRVPGAEVTLSSSSYGLTYTARTNRAGFAVFTDLVPDFYNCSVQRTYPEDTVQIYLGVSREEVLVGSKAVVQMASPADSFNVMVKRVERPSFVISEIYYNGAPPPPPLYFHDQFTEIYNNSTSTEYLDGYVIADVDYGYREQEDYIHAIHLYQFPGNGQDYPVAPGERIIIAQDADNHTLRNANSFDLSNADFEYYNPLSNDIDNPAVPNMIQIHHKYGFDFLYSVNNDAIVLAKPLESDTLGYDSFDNILLPKNRVVDGVEYKEDLTNFEFKRLSDDIDAGLAGGIPAYQGKSVARKVFKILNGQKVLQDNNNSSLDFQTLDNPSPGSIE